MIRGPRDELDFLEIETNSEILRAMSGADRHELAIPER